MNVVTHQKARSLGHWSPHLFQKAIENTRLCNLEISKQRFQHDTNLCVSAIDLDFTESRFLVSVSLNKKISIFDTYQKKTVQGNEEVISRIAHVGNLTRHQKYLHKSTCTCVQWYPHDSGMFITSSFDGTLKIWDTNRLKPVSTIKIDKKVYHHHVGSSCSHSLITSATSNNINLIDIRTSSATHVLSGHQGPIYSVRWSPKRDHLMSSGGSDGRVMLWDVRKSGSALRSLDQLEWIKSNHYNSLTISERQKIKAHSGIVNCIKFVDDGRFLLTYGTDNRLRLWDSVNWKLVSINYGHIPNNSCKRSLNMDIYNGGYTSSFVFLPSENHMVMCNIHDGCVVERFSEFIGSVRSCVVNPMTCDVYVVSSSPRIRICSPKQATNVAESVSSESQRSEPNLRNENYSNRVADNWSDNSDSESSNEW